MSGGGGSQTTTQALPGYAQPYAQQILQRGADLSNQSMPQYGGDLYANLNGTQNNAISQIQNLAGNSPTLNAANTTTQGLLTNGGNLAPNANVTASQNPYATMSNPYLDAQIGKAQGDLANEYANGTSAQTMAQFRNAGAFGGSAMQQTQQLQNNQLANALTNVDTQMRGNAYANTQQAAGQQAALNTSTDLTNQALNSSNYNDAQSRSLAAAGLAPTLDQAGYYGANQLMNAGAIQQQDAQNQDNASYQKWYNQAYSPYQQLGVLQSALSGALGNGSQGTMTSTQSGGSKFASALGGAAGGAALGSMVAGASSGAIGGPMGMAVGAGLGLLGGAL